MKANMAKFYLELLCIIICFLPRNLQADDGKKLVDVRDMLNNADAMRFQNGVTKVTGEYQIQNIMHHIITKYFYKNTNGDNLTYSESTRVSDNKKNIDARITIDRPDGNWFLLSGAAIREPDDMKIPDSIIYHDSKPVLGTTEDCLEDGEPCVRIIIIPELESDNPLRDIHRYEFLIAKGSGIIIAQRAYLGNGKVFFQMKITSVEKNCSFPISTFEIPRDYKIVFPDNQSECESIIHKYVMDRSTTNSNNHKQNQTK